MSFNRSRVFTPILIMVTIVPGLACAGLSAVYLFPEWSALDRAYRNVQAATQSPTVEKLLITQQAENRHRINCFAEGMGVLLGLITSSIGFHALYTRR